MRRILKFKIPFYDKKTIYIPKNWAVLSYQIQDGIPCLWASCDPEGEQLPFQFEWLGTGNTIPTSHVYQTTLQDGEYVWHLFINNNPQ